MKFEEKNGKYSLILDQNDELYVQMTDHDFKITLAYTNDGINISGDSRAIHKITGSGMLSKIVVPPTLSAEEILEKCDQWLAVFKEVQAIFRKLVLTEKYQEQSIMMHLNFQIYYDLEDNNPLFRTIELDLKRFNCFIMRGVSIQVNEENSDVYNYLVASVLSEYLKENYDDSPIDLITNLLNSNYQLYSKEKRANRRSPIVANLSHIPDDFVIEAISYHNLGNSYSQILTKYKNQIRSQCLSSEFDEDIEKSMKQYQLLK